MPDDLISLTEAATLVAKNLRTIQRYIKMGKMTRHQKDGKSFISRRELENKFKIMATKPQESVASEKAEDATKPPQVKPADDYQNKWVEEIQKHAQTREELGVWKGRAEAYQAFASRLLGPKGAPFGGNGNIENVDPSTPPENTSSMELGTSRDKPLGVNKSIKTYTYLIYGLIGIFFIIILFFVLIVLKVI